jgi:hypothetical protein
VPARRRGATPPRAASGGCVASYRTSTSYARARASCAQAPTKLESSATACSYAAIAWRRDSAGHGRSSPETRLHPARKRLIGGQALGRLRCQLLFGAIPKRHIQCLHHLARQCPIAPGIRRSSRHRTAAPSGSAPHARRVRPPVPGVTRTRLAPPATFSHWTGGGEQVVHPQLAGDLLLVLRRPLVFVRAAPGDDGEAPDPGSLVRRSLATPSAK